ncbi:putative NAD-dependent malic enzyme [Glarea lozoyensis 74030]|uniref:Putative NAD-dependent malic enzyme n=1 Tax=Glarea lozoyensis (strain ATCC 74030 / MF5533) TaxID=1104152 RepID=H0EGS4_GLAL7|nr:putative NAD-dependent malic enzyme [Glarea lozoyensis 74030]
MFSIIYTPTEGDAIQNYSRLFRRAEGCFLNINDVDRVHEDLAQWGEPEDIDYIVVTDCGTNNEELLNDELYLGLKQKRASGEKYDKFVDTFVQSARKLYPRAYIHFEDFGLTNDMRVVIFGSGTAGTGIADQVRDAIAADSGKSKEDAAKQLWCVDKPGLLLKSHGDKLTHAQIPYAREDSDYKGTSTSDLLSVIKAVKPHVLIGTSTQPKTFTKEVIQEMSSHVDRPIVFPLSNPTRLHEADPKDINEWSKGKALIATGSPFPPVSYNGKEYEVAECNNSTCFPGIGLGCVLSRSKLLSDKMLVAAVKALAAQSPALKDPCKGLLPDVSDVREISVHIARAVIRASQEEGLNMETEIPEGEEDLEEWVREQMWDASYRPLRLVSKETASKDAKGQLGSAGVE